MIISAIIAKLWPLIAALIAALASGAFGASAIEVKS